MRVESDPAAPHTGVHACRHPAGREAMLPPAALMDDIQFSDLRSRCAKTSASRPVAPCRARLRRQRLQPRRRPRAVLAPDPREQPRAIAGLRAPLRATASTTTHRSAATHAPSRWCRAMPSAAVFMELALACQTIVAEEGVSMGLPEVCSDCSRAWAPIPSCASARRSLPGA